MKACQFCQQIYTSSVPADEPAEFGSTGSVMTNCGFRNNNSHWTLDIWFNINESSSSCFWVINHEIHQQVCAFGSAICQEIIPTLHGWQSMLAATTWKYQPWEWSFMAWEYIKCHSGSLHWGTLVHKIYQSRRYLFSRELMRQVFWRFQNSSRILLVIMHLQCMGLWHGLAGQKKWGYGIKLKASSKF